MPRKNKPPRKSPVEPAKEFPGQTKKGLDGTLWVSKKSGKSFRWYRASSSTKQPSPKSRRVDRIHRPRTLGDIFTVTNRRPNSKNIPFDFNTCHIENPKNITIEFNEYKDGGSLNVIVPEGHRSLSSGSTYIRFANYPNDTFTLKIAEVLECITRNEFLRLHIQSFLDTYRSVLEKLESKTRQLETFIQKELPEQQQWRCETP